MEKKTRPGEKGFTLIMFVVGALLTKGSWIMYKADPSLSGYGTVPLFCGVMIMILSGFIFIKNLSHKSEISGIPMKEQASNIAHHLFSLDVVIMILIILAYCLLLVFNIPFEIASMIFLLGSMTYLQRGKFLKNILWSAIILAFVILVFNVGFGVVLP